MKRTILVFITFLLFKQISAQIKHELINIDSLLKQADFYVRKDPLKSLEYAKSVILKCDKLNCSEKKAEAYYYIANSLIFYGKYNEASIFIEKGVNEVTVKNNHYLMALFISLKSVYYSRMRLFEKQFQEDTYALNLLADSKDSNSVLLKTRFYMALADYYTEIHNYSAAHLYADKSIMLVESIPEKVYLSAKQILRYKANIYYYKACIYIAQKKPYLAFPFIKKAHNQALSEKYSYTAIFLELYGDYYSQIFNYQKALEFYLIAFENKKGFLSKTNTAVNLTTKISNIYAILGDKNNELTYRRLTEKYRVYDEEIINSRIRFLFNNVEKNYKGDKINIKQRDSFNISYIGLFFILTSAGIYYYYYYYYYRKSKKIKFNLKKEELENTSTNVRKLYFRQNDFFNEVIDLAQKNSPHFWTRFQEVYPEFSENILKINPKIKASELTFCAYIYLGFTTKEIARYTFKAPKTIENSRYNIRKKLNLSPETDLKLWLSKYVN
ncbi:TPA: hypothetical protein I9Y67_003702 [Elizabethkingia anophelis]|nr:hypothetical protein [Elizabethkingia anophelis]